MRSWQSTHSSLSTSVSSVSTEGTRKFHSVVVPDVSIPFCGKNCFCRQICMKHRPFPADLTAFFNSALSVFFPLWSLRDEKCDYNENSLSGHWSSPERRSRTTNVEALALQGSISTTRYLFGLVTSLVRCSARLYTAPSILPCIYRRYPSMY